MLPIDLSTSQYDKLWSRYKTYIESTPNAKTTYPSTNKQIWYDIKKKFDKMSIADIYAKLNESTRPAHARAYLLENELRFSKEEKQAFLESLRQFSNYKNEIYRSKKLKEVSQTIGELIESAEGFTIKETQNGFDFDSVSMSRDFKTIKENYKLFEKTCSEMHILQQRLESCYENIGTGLGRYYEL